LRLVLHSNSDGQMHKLLRNGPSKVKSLHIMRRIEPFKVKRLRGRDEGCSIPTRPAWAAPSQRTSDPWRRCRYCKVSCFGVCLAPMPVRAGWFWVLAGTPNHRPDRAASDQRLFEQPRVPRPLSAQPGTRPPRLLASATRRMPGWL